MPNVSCFVIFSKVLVIQNYYTLDLCDCVCVYLIYGVDIPNAFT